MYTKFACMLSLIVVLAAQAFDPPVDSASGLALAIEAHTPPLPGQPYAFSVVLTNANDYPVTGALSLWMNDDWHVAARIPATVTLGPGAYMDVHAEGFPAPHVVNGLYPIHACFSNSMLTLHPIAVFEAKAQPSAATHRVPLTPGSNSTINLACMTPHAVFYQQNQQTNALPIGFEGADAASGMHVHREQQMRNSELRQCLTLHPPWKKTPGTVWCDYTLVLPKTKPILLDVATAIRDCAPNEPPSDGVEFKLFVGENAQFEERFARFSAARNWEAAQVDLSRDAGKTITLRFWIGPGPKMDTTCDVGFWGNPTLSIGTRNPPSGLLKPVNFTQTEVLARTTARTGVPASDRCFVLQAAQASRWGCCITPGEAGLTDGVIAFSDGQRVLTFTGYTLELLGEPAHGVKATASAQPTAFVVDHTIALPNHQMELTIRATLRAEQGALRMAWTLVNAPQNNAQRAALTKLGLGPSRQSFTRVYMGFGAVFEKPAAFSLPYHGVQVSTRHVGADYDNGVSLVQATDLIPDRVQCLPEKNLFSFESPYETTFFYVPSDAGAFAAARAYRAVAGFRAAPGVSNVLGRVCLDQWGGNYRRAAEEIRLAAKYGLTHAVFVKHDWQRWGYDYRLPDIFPPRDDGEGFQRLRTATAEAGMLFAPHDNYIDFYPDAEGFSYNHIVFTKHGTPYKAWLNRSHGGAQSYRWNPHAFLPFLVRNMTLMRNSFAPDALFIDVFTSIPPWDFYDRAGTFHLRSETVTRWREAFDVARDILKPGSVMISESGHDALIGSIDGVQADHWRPSEWVNRYCAAERTPWHDMVTHNTMILFAGGLANRYDPDPAHGYGSDDYLSMTVLGGRGPMSAGPFNRSAVVTYWLLHDVCDTLARAEFIAHAFGPSIHQQQTTFLSCDKQSTFTNRVWVNRGSNDWKCAQHTLPCYGFYAQTEHDEAGIITRHHRRVAFAKHAGTRYFVDARPAHDAEHDAPLETQILCATQTATRAWQLMVEWKVLRPIDSGHQAFMHIGRTPTNESERIEAQGRIALPKACYTTCGVYTSTAAFHLPDTAATGTYAITYGVFHRTRGERLPLYGIPETRRRIRAGTVALHAQTTTYQRPDAAALHSEPIDFGEIITDGAFRLVRSSAHAWQLIPLPASRPFSATLRMERLAAGKRVCRVTPIDPFDCFAQPPRWTSENNVLTLMLDARAFAYEITMD